MDSKFVKGLIAAVIAIISAMIPVENAGIWFYVLTFVGGIIVYFGQNYFIKPISVFGTVDLTDVVKGLVFTFGTTLVTYGAAAISASILDVKDLWQTLVTALMLYLTKNLVSNSQGNYGTEKK